MAEISHTSGSIGRFGLAFWSRWRTHQCGDTATVSFAQMSDVALVVCRMSARRLDPPRRKKRLLQRARARRSKPNQRASTAAAAAASVSRLPDSKPAALSSQLLTTCAIAPDRDRQTLSPGKPRNEATHRHRSSSRVLVPVDLVSELISHQPGSSPKVDLLTCRPLNDRCQNMPEYSARSLAARDCGHWLRFGPIFRLSLNL